MADHDHDAAVDLGALREEALRHWPDLEVVCSRRHPVTAEGVCLDVDVYHVVVPSRYADCAPVIVGRGHYEDEALRSAITYAEGDGALFVAVRRLLRAKGVLK